MFLWPNRDTIKELLKGNNIISSEKIPKPLKIIKNLRPWQEHVLGLIKEEPNDREIIWYYIVILRCIESFGRLFSTSFINVV